MGYQVKAYREGEVEGEVPEDRSKYSADADLESAEFSLKLLFLLFLCCSFLLCLPRD
jgi:hypothetical protein